MKNVWKSISVITGAIVTILAGAQTSRAAQFPVLDPGYTQEIYTDKLDPGEGGFAWTPSGNLLTRTGSLINEYSFTQNATHMGTNVHGKINSVAVPGLSSTGVGMTNGLDGWVYTVTAVGLQRFDPTNLAAPAQTIAGTAGGAGYGVTTMPDGRIAYSDGSGSSSVWIYTPNVNPNAPGTNQLIYTMPGVLIDGMVAGPGGELALAGQSNMSITVISSTGTLINQLIGPGQGVNHYPDGMAFSPNSAAGRLYSNNNDGTITRYDLGAGYNTGIPVIMDIATGAGAYGDIAAVGPDCSFYVSQYENGSYHGATPGVGTNWNSGTNAEGSFTRIQALAQNPDGSVSPFCDFYTPLDTDVPEPGTLGLLLAGGTYLLSARRKTA